jgi:hypothetical protein
LRSFGKLNKNIMGAFSEQFKLSKRIRQADFGRQETREYWIAWANGIIEKVAPSGEALLDKFDVKEDQVVESFEDKIDNQI